MKPKGQWKVTAAAHEGVVLIAPGNQIACHGVNAM
jgi:hypothetical protein